MTIRVKLIVLTLSVALIPLILVTLTGIGVHQRAVESGVEELHQRTAEYAAALSQEYLDSVTGTLELLIQHTIAWDGLSAEEHVAATWLVYRQFDEIAVVSVIDGNGHGMGESAYVGPGVLAPEVEAHPRVVNEDLASFAEHIPFDQALAAGFAVGAAFKTVGNTVPIIPIAVQSGSIQRPIVIAVALSAEQMCARVRAATSERLEVFLADASQKVICGPAAGASLAALAGLSTGSDSQRVREYRDKDGRDLLAASYATRIGWLAVTQQPSADAFAASRRLRQQTVFWILLSAVAAILAGLFLSRSISQPLLRLVDSADALAEGNFDHRLSVDRTDEFARVSSAFNRMGEEIEKRDTEIRTWNEQLQARVEDRTRELQEAQSQLLETRKIAAVHALGAGMAHEINNPLAGVIGLTQLLRGSAEKEGATKRAETLASVEREARRIKDIVSSLLRMSQEYGGEGYRAVKIHDVIQGCLQLLDTRMREATVVATVSLADSLPPVRGEPEQLQQAFSHILSNAVLAMPQGGEISITAIIIKDQLLEVALRDTGKGIPEENLDRIFEPFFTTKDAWRGVGLGLSEAYRIIQEHHGRIKVESTVGVGTTVKVLLPIAEHGAHLV